MKKRLKKKIKPKVEPKLNKNQQALKDAQNDMQAQIRRLLEVNGIKKWAPVARFFCWLAPHPTILLHDYVTRQHARP